MHIVTRHASRQPATTFSRNLQAARAKSGLTQRQLADAIGVDTITVSRWERARSRPEEEHLMRLCTHFALDLGWFYTEQEAAA